MLVRCIDNVFTGKARDVFDRNGIIVPEHGGIYTVRTIIRHSTGQCGLLLEEIVNKKLPIHHVFIGGMVWLEPTFAAYRFEKLSGETIDCYEKIS